MPQIKAFVADQHNINLDIRTLPPEALDATVKVAFLSVTPRTTLSEAQATALRKWMEGGGTLWMDAAGGSAQAVAAFDAALAPLGLDGKARVGKRSIRRDGRRYAFRPRRQPPHSPPVAQRNERTPQPEGEVGGRSPGCLPLPRRSHRRAGGHEPLRESSALPPRWRASWWPTACWSTFPSRCHPSPAPRLVRPPARPQTRSSPRSQVPPPVPQQGLRQAR